MKLCNDDNVRLVATYAASCPPRIAPHIIDDEREREYEAAWEQVRETFKQSHGVCG